MKHRKKIILLLFVVLMIVPALSACQSGSQSGGSQSSEKTEDPVKQGTIKMEQLNTKLQKAIANKDEAAAQKLGKSLNGQWLSYENGVRDRYPLLYAQIEKYQQPIYAQSNMKTPDLAQMKANSDQLKKQLADLKTAKETKAKTSKTLNTAVENYKKYVIEQTDLLVKTTEPFAKAVEEGNIEKAKQLYSRSRVYYERVEPVAESFGDLDPRIDARINDVDDTAKWTGFHEIEKALWKDNSLKGQKKYAEQLVTDVKDLQTRVHSLQLKPKAMVAGAMELLEEAATSKITGEEERYSHTDLVDFQANIDGSEAVYQAAISSLNMDNKDLAGQLDKQFQAIDKLMLKYKTTDGQFVDYRKLTKPQLRELSNELNNLSKLMAQTAKIF